MYGLIDRANTFSKTKKETKRGHLFALFESYSTRCPKVDEVLLTPLLFLLQMNAKR